MDYNSCIALGDYPTCGALHATKITKTCDKVSVVLLFFFYIKNVCLLWFVGYFGWCLFMLSMPYVCPCVFIKVMEIRIGFLFSGLA